MRVRCIPDYTAKYRRNIDSTCYFEYYVCWEAEAPEADENRVRSRCFHPTGDERSLSDPRERIRDSEKYSDLIPVNPRPDKRAVRGDIGHPSALPSLRWAISLGVIMIELLTRTR